MLTKIFQLDEYGIRDGEMLILEVGGVMECDVPAEAEEGGYQAEPCEGMVYRIRNDIDMEFRLCKHHIDTDEFVEGVDEDVLVHDPGMECDLGREHTGCCKMGRQA